MRRVENLTTKDNVKKFQEVIEAIANSYRGEAPQGSTQERARFLYVNHYEKFINMIKDRL